jgi:hypothetical protein
VNSGGSHTRTLAGAPAVVPGVPGLGAGVTPPGVPLVAGPAVTVPRGSPPAVAEAAAVTAAVPAAGLAVGDREPGSNEQAARAATLKASKSRRMGTV